jgi:thiol-disulfide isomerase/thioredoxin
MAIHGFHPVILVPVVVFAVGCAANIEAQPAQLHLQAPELQGARWLNAPNGPISLSARRGLVTVVHFWTYGCINCKHNLPIYARWQQRFAPEHVEIIGIHSPEFEAEAIPDNVAKKAKELGITYPVLLDPSLVNWRKWKQQFWPAVYLVDRKGRIRYRWDGEMNYGQLEGEKIMTALIEQLLREQP